MKKTVQIAAAALIMAAGMAARAQQIDNRPAAPVKCLFCDLPSEEQINPSPPPPAKKEPACLFCDLPQEQQADPNVAGGGGKNIRLAVLEPAGKGLSDDDKWMLSLVQGSIYADFIKYSGMNIIDNQNIEKIYDEWEKSMSGSYSDADRVKIGNLTNASHILSGTVIKTPNAFMLELSVTDLQSGERKASYSQSVSAAALENHSAIKAASAELLTQLGVNLTSAALGELKQAANIARIQAEEALARGIVAKRQGTEVAALSYFFQAAALDPSLAEAVNRSSVMAANVSSGNIGEDARNDILWRKSWVKRLEETEQYIDHLNKTVSMPYTLFYSDEIIKGDINYEKETMSLSIKTNLHGSNSVRAWALSLERALQAVYDGLEATKRKDTWGLNWPRRPVTNLNSFERQSRIFTIAVELVNSRNKIIGRQEFKAGGTWTYNTGYGQRPGVSLGYYEYDNGRRDIRFTNVNANDITDNLTIRFASVNGEAAETVARKGVLQIKAMRKGEFDDNDLFTFVYGEIKKYNGERRQANAVINHINIPNTIWGDPVISIGGDGFEHSNLTGVTIPNSVTSIKRRTFYYGNDYLTNIGVGAGVTIDEHAFGNGFGEYYQNNGRRAGTYTRSASDNSSWYSVMTVAEQEAQRQRLERLQPGYRKPEVDSLQLEERRRKWREDANVQPPTREASTTSGGTAENSKSEGRKYKEQEPSGGGSAFIGYGALLMTGQQSAPLYNDQLNGQFTMGFTFGFESLHLGLKVEGIQRIKLQQEDSIKNEVLKFYPNIPRDDITITSRNFASTNFFARFYLGNYVYLSGGGGWWFHDVYVEEIEEWGLNKIQLAHVEWVPLFNAGLGIVTGKKGGFFFDAYYNIVLRKNGPDQYVTVNAGLQAGGRRRLSP